MVLCPLAFVISPLGILGISVVFIVAAIAVLRIHAFFALMIAAILTSLLTAAGASGAHRFVAAITAATTEFGNTAGRIGLPIALAAVIGISLMESGSADKIVRRMIAAFGETRAAFALAFSAFLLAAPVFIDTVFMLLLPIARAMGVRTGRNYLLYILAVCAGGVITSGLVPPAPGPLAVAETLKLNLGLTIIAGSIFGILPVLGGLACARWFNERMPIQPRATPGASLESLVAVASRPESELPGFWLAIAPVLLPFALISLASILSIPSVHLPYRLSLAVTLLGDKNVALFLGAIVAVAVHAQQKKISWRNAGKVLGAPLETGAMIILIVSAGGAYGEMIKRAGLGDQVKDLAGGHVINYVLLAWTLSAVMRAAQGSATVAMITAAGIVLSVAGPAGFGVHPLYILMAIGFGSKVLSWMNDAGFWMISRIGGLTQGEALRSWTIMSTVMGVLGLVEVLIVSSLWPQLIF
jgi:gluconate:H+ symporter, GntP family